jgi:hypothetical protein
MLFIFHGEDLLRFTAIHQARCLPSVGKARLLTPYIHGYLSYIAAICPISNMRMHNLSGYTAV